MSVAQDPQQDSRADQTTGVASSTARLPVAAVASAGIAASAAALVVTGLESGASTGTVALPAAGSASVGVTGSSAMSASPMPAGLKPSAMSAKAAATAPASAVVYPPSAAEAARFLQQCSIAATDADISALQSMGYSAWLDAEFNRTATQSNYDWLVAQGHTASTQIFSSAGIDNALWRSLIAEQNPVMQRLAMFWLEYFVVSLAGLPVGWPQFMGAAYVDLLTQMAVANFRDLLKAVTLSPAMGEYLSLSGSLPADATTNRHPDENYAREVMQLFTLGLYELNPDGSQVLVKGVPQPTYGQNDVTGLAAALTGWDFAASDSAPRYALLPMVQVPGHHATYSSSFLGVTVPANTSGTAALEIILDTLFHHPNLAPFLSRQLIQRLVSSNPSPAYVARVAAVFANDGTGVRGNMRAVFKAALLDAEARNTAATATGRLREPMLRFAQWARTFKAQSASGAWSIGSTSDPATGLGQSPLRAPTVFNFFSPSYAPPGTALASAGEVAPETQILDESTVAGYLNFMQQAIGSGVGDVTANYSSELVLATNVSALLARLNLLLTANQLDTLTLGTISAAVSAIDASTAAGQKARVEAAIFLVMASPAYQVLK